MAGNGRDLTEGPVWRNLVAVAGPMMFGILAVVSTGIVDAYFLAKVSPEALAAVGFIYPVTTAIMSLSIGLSAGASAVISQALGRRDGHDDVTRRGLHALALGLCFASLAALLFWLLDKPLLGLLGADEKVLEAALRYTPIWCLAFPFLVTMMLINAIFRAHGNGFWSAAIMVASAVVNVASTPVLILGLGPVPELGIAGAAWGTFLAMATAAALAAALALKDGILQPCEAPLRDFMRNAKAIGGVGGPAATSNAIRPAGMALVTAAVATVGSDYVGGFGAATRVQSLICVPFLALSAGIGPVVGQNWGADRKDRSREGLRLCLLFSLGYGLLIALTLSFFAGPIAQAFGASDDSTAAAKSYLRIVGWSLFGYGMLVTGNASLNAISKAGHAMTLSLARVLAVYVPLAWLGVTLFGYTGILGAAVMANVFGAWAVLVAGRATGLLKIDMPPVRWAASRVPS
ncbi:Staphylococcal virulence regulator protein A [Jannaschia seosinensis]|uniref:Staphylococcal virulence regulator protein A n=1 Tax=Jannaschia seosinensis TaxID=313367 RepID=A0A0M7B9L5_9RHOB|nr:MATE family efflux transporter [Jannaschia seosinensis]CUH38889.1 Staphylococcal virulence regulator protein A [Jannaschia seosinensis]